MSKEIKIFINEEDWDWLIEMQSEARTRSVYVRSFPMFRNDIGLVVSRTMKRDEYAYATADKATEEIEF
jgi:hypothetical protein